MSQKEQNRTGQELFGAGCSAVAWETKDGKHLWGRNFDFNRLADGTQVLFVPRGTQFYTQGCALEGNLVESTRRQSQYGIVGIGLDALKSTPAFYEGMNEKGLMGGQLYYRGFAHFPDTVQPNTLAVQPPFAVTYLLATCATVEQVALEVEQHITLLGQPLLGTVPPLHWMFSDVTGESIIIEPDQDGVHIYRNTMGVMANSPSYSWHRLNLLNYIQIRDLDYDTLEINQERLNQCFSGSGALGLPGDWSSPSRFVRLSFLKQYGVKGQDEPQGVTNLFRLMSSAAFPLGMVRVSQPGDPSQLDSQVSLYDYTIYTSVMCAESQRFYWTTYENPRIQYVDMSHLAAKGQPCQFDLGPTQDFRCLSDK